MASAALRPIRQRRRRSLARLRCVFWSRWEQRIKMPVDNRIAPQRRDWSNISLAIRPQGAGAVFEELTLDERIGPEAVLLLIETAPEELLGRRKLMLELKAGVAATDYGPILFLVWWIPPLIDDRPFAFYEQLMNPLHPGTSDILARVADQTHLHIVLLSTGGQILTVFEYENSFGFNGIHAGVQGARVAWHGRADFGLAKQAYQQEYDVYKLLAGAYG
jgi:hypothetical protein